MAISDLGRDRAKDIGTGVAPVYADAAAATAINPPVGGAGAQAGCYDTAANRNLAIASLTAAIADMAVLRVELQGMGFVAGSVTEVGRTRARDFGCGRTPRRAVSVTATASAPPAGGTGETVGGYDTAGNRNLFITSLTALIADVAAMRTQVQAVNLVSGGVSAVGKARMRDLGTGRTPRLSVDITATAVNPPAGGTGANAGGYDSAANRDLMVVSLTAVLVDIAALRAELVEVNIVAA